MGPRARRTSDREPDRRYGIWRIRLETLQKRDTFGDRSEPGPRRHGDGDLRDDLSGIARDERRSGLWNNRHVTESYSPDFVNLLGDAVTNIPTRRRGS